MRSWGPRSPCSIDYEALRQHVTDFPDSTLAERAKHFGVSEHGIFYALKELNITQKTPTYKEQCPVKREAYLSCFEQEVVIGGKHPVYIDETGFAEEDFRRYAYAPKVSVLKIKCQGVSNIEAQH